MLLVWAVAVPFRRRAVCHRPSVEALLKNFNNIVLAGHNQGPANKTGYVTSMLLFGDRSYDRLLKSVTNPLRLYAIESRFFE